MSSSTPTVRLPPFFWASAGLATAATRATQASAVLRIMDFIPVPPRTLRPLAAYRTGTLGRNHRGIDRFGIEFRNLGRAPFEHTPGVDRALVGDLAVRHRRRRLERQQAADARARSAAPLVEFHQPAREIRPPLAGAGRRVEPD